METLPHPMPLSSRPATGNRMIRTGYFAKHGRHPGAVSIARFPPRWFTGPRCFALAPPPELLRLHDWDTYRARYRQEVLDRLDPGSVLRELESLAGSPDVILLCFEKSRVFCHRRLVAEWFGETKGIPVPETGDEGQQTF